MDGIFKYLVYATGIWIWRGDINKKPREGGQSQLTSR